MCEAVMRNKFPNASAGEVAERAREFWYASSDGSLLHVVGAYRSMRMKQIAMGTVPEEDFPEEPEFGELILRKSSGGCEEMCWNGTGWKPHGEWRLTR